MKKLAYRYDKLTYRNDKLTKRKEFSHDVNVPSIHIRHQPAIVT